MTDTAPGGALSRLDTRSRVGIGVVVLLLAVLAATRLLGGADEPLPAVPVVAAGAPAPLAASASPAPPAALVAQGAVKDPFRSLVGEGGAAAPAAPAPAVPVLAAPLPQPPALDVPAVDVPAVEVPVVGLPAAAPAVDPAPAVPPAAAPPAAPTRVLVLQSVGGEGADLTATFTLDGDTHTATVGESFAGLALRALQQGPRPGQWTAVVQPSGQDPFDLVSGAPHRL